MLQELKILAVLFLSLSVAACGGGGGGGGGTPAGGAPAGKVWFVDNSFAGTSDGSQTAPFRTLAAATAVAAANETIFVFRGDGTATGQDAGVTLAAGQKLIGQGVPLVVGGVTLVPAAATPPVITNASVAPVVTLAGSNTEVAGLAIQGSGTNNIGILGNAVTGFNIHDNTLTGLSREPISLPNGGGVGQIVRNQIVNNAAAGASGNAVDIVTNAAGAAFTVSDNTIQDAASTGIRILFNGGGGTVGVLRNSVPSFGVQDAQRRGIDIDASLGAVVTSTIEGNTVDAAGANGPRAGIQVNATTGGRHTVLMNNNTASNSPAAPAEGGIQVTVSDATSSICLRMAGNATNSGVLLDNSVAVSTALRAEGTVAAPTQAGFEGANPGVTAPPGFQYLPNAAGISFVPAGTCGP
ncbi:MAG: right-handed parallel beta-helix repeat-containing protein [Deltaproteobacteria bacterium]|nr:right-handed parallel beta-helix repeat-containing protein [Deltaproteobacteria bacterium]